MVSSKSRRLAWLIQKLEEMRSSNASRRDRAIRAWLRPDGIMAMIVEALALAEELDGGRWLNWVDLPGEPKGYLGTFPSRAQYERVLKGKGPKYHAARRYHRLYVCPELRAQWMRTKPVTRDELLAMAARAQARPIADHYPGKRTGKAKAEPDVAGLTIIPFALLKERHPAFTPAFDRLRQRFEAGDKVAWAHTFFSTTMHSFKNPVLVHEKDADGRDVYFYLGNDIHIGRETLGVGAQPWTADMEDALVDVVKAELSIEQVGGVASSLAAGASSASGACAEGASAAWPVDGANLVSADYGKPVAIAPLKYSGDNKEGRGPHFDPSGYTVIAGLNLTGYATLGFSRQGRKVVKEVLLRPGDLYILRGEAVHGWQHRLSAPHQQDEGDDRVVLLLRYVSRDKLEQSLGMLRAASATPPPTPPPGLAILAAAASGHPTRARTAGH